jgi:RTX calcium-binding nonapeptide repeat (4 copies)
MKNLIRIEKPHAMRSLSVVSAAVAVAAAITGASADGVLAGTGKAATHATTATLTNGVLTVEGSNAGDRIALGLEAGQPSILQVDVGDDGSADFSFGRAQITSIAVHAGNGGDSVRIDETNGVFANTIPTRIDGGNGDDRLVGGNGAVTVDGGNGNDAIFGGSGAETLIGGNGNDTIDGNKGNDTALLGNGDDTFIWDPGDGSDTIEGQNGDDTMVFNDAPAAEHVELSANGNRLRFFRDVGNVTMNTSGVERVDLNALGGADVTTVNDLSGTDVKEFNVDLAGALGGTTGDGEPDRVVINGTNGDDRIDVDGNADGVAVHGLDPTVRIFHSEVANDSLEINTQAGADTVSSAGLAAGVIQLFVDGVLVQ